MFYVYSIFKYIIKISFGDFFSNFFCYIEFKVVLYLARYIAQISLTFPLLEGIQGFRYLKCVCVCIEVIVRRWWWDLGRITLIHPHILIF